MVRHIAQASRQEKTRPCEKRAGCQSGGYITSPCIAAVINNFKPSPPASKPPAQARVTLPWNLLFKSKSKADIPPSVSPKVTRQNRPQQTLRVSQPSSPAKSHMSETCRLTSILPALRLGERPTRHRCRIPKPAAPIPQAPIQPSHGLGDGPFPRAREAQLHAPRDLHRIRDTGQEG